MKRYIVKVKKEDVTIETAAHEMNNGSEVKIMKN